VVTLHPLSAPVYSPTARTRLLSPLGVWGGPESYRRVMGVELALDTGEDARADGLVRARVVHGIRSPEGRLSRKRVQCIGRPYFHGGRLPYLYGSARVLKGVGLVDNGRVRT